MKITDKSICSMIVSKDFKDHHINYCNKVSTLPYNEGQKKTLTEKLNFYNQSGFRMLVFSKKSKENLDNYLIPKEIRLDVLRGLPNRKDVLADNDPSLGVRGIQDSQQARLFFLLYFCMTSLHALHMLVGFVLIGIIAYFAYQGAYSPEYYSPVENIGLYWHFVDIVWIFLFPLLYLLGAHMGH